MTVFKTFLKVLSKCKGTIILYTIILVLFGTLNFSTNDNSIDFISSKADIAIVNNDIETGVTKSLIKYLSDNSNIIELKDNEEALDDALFYRDVNYIIYIPKNYNSDFLQDKNPRIEIKSTGDYNASYAEMLLNKYLKTANIYRKNGYSEEELVNKVEEALNTEINVEVTSKLDSNNLAKANRYYSFMNYSMLAGCIFVICLILSSFKKEAVSKRISISSTNYKYHSRILLIGNTLFALILWLIYVIISIILIGKIMFTGWGLLYILNSFIFTMCSVSLAFLLSNLIKNREAINGIINVIALGSSFLCGAFVPMDMMPKSVLSIAHILPSYYFIKNNYSLTEIEDLCFTNLKPFIINIIIIIVFSIIFITIVNIINKKKKY